MTDRRHAGEDIDVLGLEDVLQDTDPADGERADELLEGLLGAYYAKRKDIPSRPEASPKEDERKADPSPEQTASGQWVCRFCGSERRSPDGVPRAQYLSRTVPIMITALAEDSETPGR